MGWGSQGSSPLYENPDLAAFVASFPGLPTVQFLIALQYAKTDGEGLIYFILNIVTPPNWDFILRRKRRGGGMY